MIARRGVALLLAACMVAVPGTPAGKRKRDKQQGKAEKGQVQIELAEGEVAPETLLDVGLRVLETGLPDEEAELEELETKGVFEDVRKSEARFIPYHLKDTLEASGHWGAVRMLPDNESITDVTCDGQILTSNGLTLVMTITVTDSTGRVWFERKYKSTADPEAYSANAVERRDPFQNLYIELANDMVAAREKLDEDELIEIREVTRLRFAADLAPVAFADYLDENRKGRIRAERLPASDDPMMERVTRIRERDFLFVDTLNEQYAEFYARMLNPYQEWRKYSNEEQIALNELRREAMTRKVVGGLLLLGGLFFGGGSTIGKVASDAALIGGAAAIKSGFDKSKEARIHREALRELAQSFDSEMTPLVVDVDGQVLRLEGSAEGQYAEWRKLLREIFETETGLPQNPNASASIGTTGGSR